MNISNKIKTNLFKDQNSYQYIWLFATALSVLLIMYFSYINIGYQLDDSLIYLRYIKNFLNGEGLVYNKGVYFNGLTSPFYSYVMVFLSYLTGEKNLQYLSIAVSALSLSATSILGATLFYNKNNTWYFISILTVGTFPYFYTVYGMETNLFLLLIVTSLYLYKTNNIKLLGISCALLFLTRSEGIFLIIPIALAYIYKNRKIPDTKYLLVPITILALNFVFNKAYYGAFLPETGAAKIWQGQSGLWGEKWIFLNFSYLFSWIFNNNHTFLSCFVFFITGNFFKKITEIDLIVIFFLFFYSCFYIFLNIPSYHWYYAPYFLFGLMYSIKGASHIFSALKKINLWLAVSVILLPVSIIFYNNIQITKVERGPFPSYKEIGIWLKKNTTTDSKIALVEIGTVGWYSERYIIDILGLVNPYNAKLIGEKKFAQWLEHYEPDYILVHDPLWGHEISADMLIKKNLYKKDERFDFKGYMLLKKATSEKLSVTQEQFEEFQRQKLENFSTIIEPKPLNEKLDGLCSLDTINGSITRSATVSRKIPLSISGWIVNNTATGATQEKVVIRLSSTDGSSLFYASASNQKISRPDVASALRNPNFEKSGFNLMATLKAVSTGQYNLELIQLNNNTLLICPDKGSLVITE